MKRLILGSGSPRRRELLAGLNLDFTVDKENNFDEGPEPGVDARRIPLDMAVGKSLGFHRPLGPDEVLLTADTVVIVDGKVLGKPHSRQEASRMLHLLSGRSHEVVTAVVIRDALRQESFTDSTRVDFLSLSEEQIDYYIDNYKPFDKAGAYGVQEWIGYVGISGICGSFYNVMGLPVHKVAAALKDFLG